MKRHLTKFLGRAGAVKRRKFSPLALEQLEDRTTPAAFTWVGVAGDGKWETARNWAGTPAILNDYPGWDGAAATTNDTALIAVNQDVTMQNAHELASLILRKPFAGTLTLQGTLTLNDGGTMEDGTIIQNTAGKNGPIHLTGGLFQWNGGSINYSSNVATSASDFQISNNALARFAPTTINAHFGSNITIAGSGALKLSNARQPIILANQATITNSGVIEITVRNPQGLIVTPGEQPSTIINTGHIFKTGDGQYVITNPLDNRDLLRISEGQLRFKAKDATTDYSVTNTHANAVIDLRAGTTLEAEEGVKQTAGTIKLTQTGRAFIHSLLNVQGGNVKLETSASILQVQGDMTFSAGTVSLTAETVGGMDRNSRVEVWGATGITVTAAPTTVDVVFLGGAQPQTMDVMRAIKGSISAVAQGKPAGYTLTREQVGLTANNTYRLTRNNGGGGMASIHGSVWDDENIDDLQDFGEPGLGGISVTLLDSVGTTVATTSTGADGQFFFTSITPGSYKIQVDSPSGSEFVGKDAGDDGLDSDVDNTGVSDLFTASAGDDITIDAGLLTPALITGRAWEDRNGDGIQDEGEGVLAGVTVRILDDSQTLLDDTTTDAGGNYAFSGLAPGDYYIEVLEPSGYFFTLQNQVSEEDLDSDTDPADGRTGLVSVGWDQNAASVDAGLYELGSITGTVWEDIDGDGVREQGESLLQSVTVELLDASSSVIDSTTTAANGSYEFEDLVPGDYFIRLGDSAPYAVTVRDAGSDDTIDSDAEPVTEVAPAPVTSGEAVSNLDIGVYTPVTVNGKAWTDTDADGLRETGEDPLSGVNVTLLTAADIQVAETTTDGSGDFSFTDLAPGEYYLVFEGPDGQGYYFTLQNQGSDEGIDSDVNSSGRSANFTRTSGQSAFTLDAGLYQKGAVSGRVWEDRNGNGWRNEDEPSIAGVTVELLDGLGEVIDSKVSASNGTYEFTDLVPGTHSVRVVLTGDQKLTLQNVGGEHVDSDAAPLTRIAQAVVTSGETTPQTDFGLYVPVTVRGKAWTDTDADGIRDGSESGLAGIDVDLYDNTDTLIASDTTDSSGDFSFEDVTPGIYYLVFEKPSGYYVSPQDQGSDDTVDSDTDADGETAPFALESDQDDAVLDAGLYQRGTLSGLAWKDTDEDGIRDTGEAILVGVSVRLLDANGGEVDTTVTDSNGLYSFTDLVPAEYRVEFAEPTNYLFTDANQGVDDTADSDADTSNGQTGLYAVGSNQTVSGVDAGFITALGSVAGRVWDDADADGIEDVGESGLAGRLVRLYDSSDNLIQTTNTVTGGDYFFAGVAAGQYKIRVGTESQYTFADKDQGSDDTVDSDVNADGFSDLFSLAIRELLTDLDAAIV